ncbi:MAG: hypothetical protein U0525_02695 [Patescibacteria group bacterium]
MVERHAEGGLSFSYYENRLRQAASKPEARRRLEDLFRVYEQIVWGAKKLGIKDTYFMGSLASPNLRDYRPHDDVDFFIPDEGDLQRLIKLLNFRDRRPVALHGSSLHYLTHPGNGVPVELRSGVPSMQIEGRRVYYFKQPIWSKLLMPQPMVMPPSALSDAGETLSWNGVASRFVRPEYHWMVKVASPYLKDLLDANILEKSSHLDVEIMTRIRHEVKMAGGTMVLPIPLISIIRSFGFWNLSNEDYRLLHDKSLSNRSSRSVFSGRV